MPASSRPFPDPDFRVLFESAPGLYLVLGQTTEPANSDRRVSIPLLAFLNSLTDEAPANVGAELPKNPGPEVTKHRRPNSIESHAAN